MYISARQLEDLHRAAGGNGRVVLPYGARLTPLAADWVRHRRVKVGYGPAEITTAEAAHPSVGESSRAAAPAPLAVPAAPSAASHASASRSDLAAPSALPYVWWCDGPSGPAKAAAAAVAREAHLQESDHPGEARQLHTVIRDLAGRVKSNQAAGGILLVQSGGAAIVLANRCRALRAVPGTTFESLQAAIDAVAANVLVVEYPRRTFSEIRTLVSRFVRGRRDPDDDLRRQLEDLSSCG